VGGVSGLSLPVDIADQAVSLVSHTNGYSTLVLPIITVTKQNQNTFLKESK